MYPKVIKFLMWELCCGWLNWQCLSKSKMRLNKLSILTKPCLFYMRQFCSGWFTVRSKDKFEDSGTSTLYIYWQKMRLFKYFGRYRQAFPSRHHIINSSSHRVATFPVTSSKLSFFGFHQLVDSKIFFSHDHNIFHAAVHTAYTMFKLQRTFSSESHLLHCFADE